MARSLPGSRAGTARLGLLIGCLAALAVGVARAEPPAAVEALRGRLEVLRTRQPRSLPDSLFPSLEHVLDVAQRIEGKFPSQSLEWRARAARYLESAERGQDPYPLERGRIVSRGYVSPISRRVQGYTVYVPPDYTPDKRWPLMIVLHGGSSNGNLFLGVVLGNNMNWKEYDIHLWDTYEPRWSPPWIVAAADGYGQVLWRYMGEQDVLDVIDDIQRNYSVDSGRVVLSGLSNGGVGAYAIGSRHASRFSVVQAMAGAPSWLMYTGAGSVQEIEAKLMRPWSAMDLAENWFNTDFRYYHGTVDPGPMKPAYVHELDAVVEAKKIPHTGKWFEAGHDLLYLVHRHGSAYSEFESLRRQQRPAEVHLVTGDFRAARQHWLEVTRFTRYPDLARLLGKVAQDRVEVDAQNVSAFAIDLRELPVTTAELEFWIDGAKVARAGRATLGHRVHFFKGERWQLGLPPGQGLQKRAGLSGPITDAYFERMVHVYGTQRAEHAAELEQIAQKGARGWPLWLWTVEQEVVKDTDVTPELAADAHLVLYGTPGDNALLDRIMERLPIRVAGDAVSLGSARFTSKGVGVRFIYPNPEAPGRYVIVQSGPTLDGVKRGHNLPDFVPDYVIYDAATAAARPRLVPQRPPLARGFFDASWQLAP
jgi:Putative esterase